MDACVQRELLYISMKILILYGSVNKGPICILACYIARYEQRDIGIDSKQCIACTQRDEDVGIRDGINRKIRQNMTIEWTLSTVSMFRDVCIILEKCTKLLLVSTVKLEGRISNTKSECSLFLHLSHSLAPFLALCFLSIFCNAVQPHPLLLQSAKQRGYK